MQKINSLLLHENIKTENYLSRIAYQETKKETPVASRKEKHITIDITEIKMMSNIKMTLCQKI